LCLAAGEQREPFLPQENSVNLERRLAPRYPVALDIEINGGTGVTTNLSTSGVYFETTCVVKADQEISLIFPFKHAAPSGTRAACTARVRRVERRGKAFGVAATYEAIAFEVP
jgi:hypothetical protein